MPPARYSAWRHARGDHGTLAPGRRVPGRGTTDAVMAPTVGSQLSPVYGDDRTIVVGYTPPPIRMPPLVPAPPWYGMLHGMTEVIRFDGVTKSYQSGVPSALSGVSLTVGAGETVAV